MGRYSAIKVRKQNLPNLVLESEVRQRRFFVPRYNIPAELTEMPVTPGIKTGGRQRTISGPISSPAIDDDWCHSSQISSSPDSGCFDNSWSSASSLRNTSLECQDRSPWDILTYPALSLKKRLRRRPSFLDDSSRRGIQPNLTPLFLTLSIFLLAVIGILYFIKNASNEHEPDLFLQKIKTDSSSLDYPDDPQFRGGYIANPENLLSDVDYPDDPSFRGANTKADLEDTLDYPDDPKFRGGKIVNPQGMEADSDYPDDPMFRVTKLDKTGDLETNFDYPDDPSFRGGNVVKSVDRKLDVDDPDDPQFRGRDIVFPSDFEADSDYPDNPSFRGGNAVNSEDENHSVDYPDDPQFRGGNTPQDMTAGAFLKVAIIDEHKEPEGDVDYPDDPKFRGLQSSSWNSNQKDTEIVSKPDESNATQLRDKREVDVSSIEKSEKLRQTIMEERRRKMLQEREILKLKIKEEKEEKRKRAVEEKREKTIKERRNFSRKLVKGKRRKQGMGFHLRF